MNLDRLRTYLVVGIDCLSEMHNLTIAYLNTSVSVPHSGPRGRQVVNFVNTVVGAAVGVGLGLAWGV